MSEAQDLRMLVDLALAALTLIRDNPHIEPTVVAGETLKRLAPAIARAAGVKNQEEK